MLVRVGERSWRRRFVRDEPQMTGSYPLALRQLVLRTDGRWFGRGAGEAADAKGWLVTKLYKDR
jgi:hypothetical protein